jgi:hypothetical protein
MGFVNYDRNNNFVFKNAILPAAHTTAQTGIAVDTMPAAGADRTKMVTFIATVGAVTDGTIDFTVEESDASGSGYAAIASSRVFGTLAAALTSANDDKVVAISVKPNKRYVRINTVETVASAGYILGVVAMLETF